MEVGKIKKEGKATQKVKPKVQEHAADYELINQCLVIKLNKELDHHSSLMIREKTDKMIDRGTVKNIIFDFEGANFMDSSGIGLIMGRVRTAESYGGRVFVANTSSYLKRVMRIAGLMGVVSFCDTEEEKI